MLFNYKLEYYSRLCCCVFIIFRLIFMSKSSILQIQSLPDWIEQETEIRFNYKQLEYYSRALFPLYHIHNFPLDFYVQKSYFYVKKKSLMLNIVNTIAGGLNWTRNRNSFLPEFFFLLAELLSIKLMLEFFLAASCPRGFFFTPLDII